MRVLPIVAGTAALIAGSPVAYADSFAPCAVGVQVVSECPLDLLAGCLPEDALVFPGGAQPGVAEGFPACDFGEDSPLWDASPAENVSEATPPEDPYDPTRARQYDLLGSRPARLRPSRAPLHPARAANAAGTPPARPGGDPTSIVQRGHAVKEAERASVDNSAGHGRMGGGPLPAGPQPDLPPDGSSFVDSHVRSRPVLPPIVPGPSGPTSAGSRLTTLAPGGPLRAGRRSWAAMVGAAVVAEAGLLWLAVGLALRRRRLRRKN